MSVWNVKILCEMWRYCVKCKCDNRLIRYSKAVRTICYARSIVGGIKTCYLKLNCSCSSWQGFIENYYRPAARYLASQCISLDKSRKKHLKGNPEFFSRIIFWGGSPSRADHLLRIQGSAAAVAAAAAWKTSFLGRRNRNRRIWNISPFCSLPQISLRDAPTAERILPLKEL